MTFLLGGLWHDAGWTFVLWGAMHGSGAAFHKWWQGQGVKMPKWLAWLITFNFVNIAWVFFRAKSFNDSVKVFEGMAGLHGVSLPHGMPDISVPLVIIMVAVVTLSKNSMELKERFRPSRGYLLFALLALAISLFSMERVSEFLYFQF
jgi:D-alanyl-lipoteichoic acid acyltransferase DltB (MBOAT superfamily)